MELSAIAFELGGVAAVPTTDVAGAGKAPEAEAKSKPAPSRMRQRMMLHKQALQEAQEREARERREQLETRRQKMNQQRQQRQQHLQRQQRQQQKDMEALDLRDHEQAQANAEERALRVLQPAVQPAVQTAATAVQAVAPPAAVCAMRASDPQPKLTLKVATSGSGKSATTVKLKVGRQSSAPLPQSKPVVDGKAEAAGLGSVGRQASAPLPAAVGAAGGSSGGGGSGGGAGSGCGADSERLPGKRAAGPGMLLRALWSKSRATKGAKGVVKGQAGEGVSDGESPRNVASFTEADKLAAGPEPGKENEGENGVFQSGNGRSARGQQREKGTRRTQGAAACGGLAPAAEGIPTGAGAAATTAATAADASSQGSQGPPGAAPAPARTAQSQSSPAVKALYGRSEVMEKNIETGLQVSDYLDSVGATPTRVAGILHPYLTEERVVLSPFTPSKFKLDLDLSSH
jgi:hypothetical protein